MSSSNPKDKVPSIAIIPESSHNIPSTLTPVDGFLSPTSLSSRRATSLDVPASPIGTDDGSSITPSSPTLSNRSSLVHFKTSTDLRDNDPEHHSHHRKLSNATFTSETTEADPHNTDLTTRFTVESALTAVDRNEASSSSKPPDSSDPHKKPKSKKKRGKKIGDNPGKTAYQIELEQDGGVDPAPFAFRPFQLAHTLDSKDLDAISAFGGTSGLLRGLGTNTHEGLSHEAVLSRIHSAHSLVEGGKGAGLGASQRHQPQLKMEMVPAITLTSPDGPTMAEVASIESSENGPAYHASLHARRRVYGENLLPTRPSKTLLQLMWLALKDKVLILLSIAAVISLALGLFQDFGTPRTPGEAPVDWVEGVAIMVAVLIVVVVGSLNDWQKERQFKTLNDKKEERGVKVIREGVERLVDVKQVVVGDIALIEPGEIIPCDGVFLSGHNVKCDESGATGESDAIKKLPFEDCMEILRAGGGLAHTDCFMVSGSKVLEGVGRYVVVAVGMKSFNGRIMMALRGDAEHTPLQLKLNNLAELIAKIGSLAGLLLFVALLIRFFVHLGQGVPVQTASQKGIAFVNILIISVTVIVVAVPEGLPLAVTLALAFATKRMTYEKLLVRVLGSCETMANASVICTDKTGTLTQNTMSVVAGSVGIHGKFVRELEENAARTNADEKTDEKIEPRERKHKDDFSIDQAQLNTILPLPLKKLFNEAIAVNSTAFEDVDPESNLVVFVGSKTETALLQFAKELGWADFRKTREEADVVQMIPFSSERKCMAVVVRKESGRNYRVFFKGASEILSKKCTRHVVVTPPPQGENAGLDEGKKRMNEGEEEDGAIETKAIDLLAEENISRTIIFYANQTLRTIALCYRDFDSWPPPNVELSEESEVPLEFLAEDLTLIGITGIEDPLREGVRAAVAKCHKAGVVVKMCTGDNVLTARSIASQCGIFTPGGIIMEGPVFRKLSQTEMVEIVPRLQVLARSSPEDKKILVEMLKSIGEVVGVTGDGTNDGPALKTAHVGFSMGIAGTEVAKEASDIILMDDNFSSIVKAIMWGRCVNDAVRKFLQFQVSTNITAVIITFVTAVASTQETSVLSAVQLLWINIIMDTFAALALATDPASESLLDRKPDKKTAPLFSTEMYKQIMFQSMYQILIILIFHFLGPQILTFPANMSTNTRDLTVQTLVFNAFVFAQIFNSVNCRRLDKKLNIFEGITKNRYFIAITLIEIAVQVLIVFVGGAAFQVTRVGGREWGVSLALGVASIPLGALIRLMPSEPFERFFKRVGLLGRDQVLPSVQPDAEAWSGASALVRDNLGMFANIRGGRMRSSSIVLKSRLMRRHSHDIPKPLKASSLMTMVPTLVAGTIVVRPKPNGKLSDPADADPSRSSAALWEGRLQLHPDTSPDDPAFKRYGNPKFP